MSRMCCRNGKVSEVWSTKPVLVSVVDDASATESMADAIEREPTGSDLPVRQQMNPVIRQWLRASRILPSFYAD